MKYQLLAGIAAVIMLGAGESNCTPQQDANQIQAQQQDQITTEAALEVGMPRIVFHREQRLLKQLYEMRDDGNLITYSYLFVEMTGKFVPLCKSIGFPLPYSTQYSAPTRLRTGYGTEDVPIEDPQSEPNGIYPPSSADGTWVMCVGPDGQPHPTYEEPKVSTFMWELPASELQP